MRVRRHTRNIHLCFNCICYMKCGMQSDGPVTHMLRLGCTVEDRRGAPSFQMTSQCNNLSSRQSASIHKIRHSQLEEQHAGMSKIVTYQAKTQQRWKSETGPVIRGESGNYCSLTLLWQQIPVGSSTYLRSGKENKPHQLLKLN